MAEIRKIAAILVSDVVGYSRLASIDEDHTLARLRSLRRELIEPTVAAHNGRIVKSTGDGSLVEFRSVVDSVLCALALQKAMAKRNVGVARDRRIVFRIGIHLGDIVEESDGDLMGDGVNIAARLEGIAKPGGICLSEDVYRQVKARLDTPVTDLGETQLKNIAEPIRAYSLEIGKASIVRRLRRPRSWRSSATPSWLVAASIALGASVAYYAASPPAAPVASLRTEPVASLQGGPVATLAAPSVASLYAGPVAPLAAAPVSKEPPLAQVPTEPAYAGAPVREPHKVARTAAPVRPNRARSRPPVVANENVAAVADAPPPSSPNDFEQAHKAGWVAWPSQPSPTPPVIAKEAPGAFTDGAFQSDWYASPNNYEEAHKGGWVPPSARPDPPLSAPAAATNQAFAAADASYQSDWRASPNDSEEAHKGGWVPPSARTDRPYSAVAAANQAFAAAADAPYQPDWRAAPNDYEQAHKGGWVAPQ